MIHGIYRDAITRLKDIRIKLKRRRMKRIFTLIAAAMTALASMATDYTDKLQVLVNGSGATQEATISLIEEGDGSYNFTVGSPGEYSFNGYIMMPNAAGEIIRRDFVQKYNVIAPFTCATPRFSSRRPLPDVPQRATLSRH